MFNEREGRQNKVIIGGFRKDAKSEPHIPAQVFKNQSNPIRKNLFKLFHPNIGKNKFDYSSFSKFSPEDLR